jgi:hypothetical protein
VIGPVYAFPDAHAPPVPLFEQNVAAEADAVPANAIKAAATTAARLTAFKYFTDILLGDPTLTRRLLITARGGAW